MRPPIVKGKVSSMSSFLRHPHSNSPAGVARLTLLSLMLLAACASAPAGFAADALQDVVNRGNAAAEKQDYATAIQYYEQAIQKAPSESILKRNLSVLYANYAVNLQEQKKFDEALRYLDKGKALTASGSKEAKSIQDARASVLFSRAMDMRDTVQNPTAADYAKMRELLENAITLSPTEAAFKKGLAGVYMDEAYQLALQEKYADAKTLLENALKYDSQNKAVKQSLANVYLGLAKNDIDHRKEYVEKALSLDSSPQLKKSADRMLGLDIAADAGVSDGFAATPDESKAKAPREISKLSVAEMIHDMEAQLQLTPDKNATLTDRLAVLEKQVLGKTQNGALAVRTKTVYTALMGSFDGTLAQSNPKLVQAPVLASTGSYLDEIFKVTDGKVIRWGKFPLRVYFEEPKDNPLFKPEYKEAALKGLNIWKSRTDGFVNFVEIKNPQAADILISWTDQYVNRFTDPDKVSTSFKNYTPPKRSPLMTVAQVASMVTPGYFSLAPQAAAAALQYQQMKKMDVIKEESKIKLGLEPTKSLAPEAAQLLIQNMAAKEFGHALGLKGTSPESGDLLYPDLRSDIAQVPSSRDLATLRDLYNRPPNIILNVR
ncbi:MAG: repeat protein [Vampirovibrio sp.]|nr:repeat protein [Vampirovibrio sp.]